MGTDIDRMVMADYGVTLDSGGMAAYERALEGPRKLTSKSQYLKACARIFRTPNTDWVADHRLLNVGWNRVSPREWIGRPVRLSTDRDGSDWEMDPTSAFERFRSYWARAVERPTIVGSSRNEITPEQAYECMRAGIPARIVRWVPHDRLCSRDGKVHRMGPGRVRYMSDVARALRRASLGRAAVGLSSIISTECLRRLGQLCPELQAVALDTLQWVDGVGPGKHCRAYWGAHAQWEEQERANALRWVYPKIRSRDIDWSAVAAAQKLMQNNPRMRIVHASGKRQMQLFRDLTQGGESGWYDRENLIKYLAPAFAGLTRLDKEGLQYAQRLARGESPVQIAGGILAPKEAHEWLASGECADPARWLRDNSGLPPSASHDALSLPVLRWLQAVKARGDWDLIMRDRTFAGPASLRIRGCFFHRIDELRDDDLVHGDATGVIAAFERAKARFEEQLRSSAVNDHRPLAPRPKWLPEELPIGVRWLNTGAELSVEGTSMGHCILSYLAQVQERVTVVVSIITWGDRSTAAYDAHGRITQIRGPHNREPHPSHVEIAHALPVREQKAAV